MDKVTINGKEYQIDIEKCKEQGLLIENTPQIKTWTEFQRYCNEHEIPLFDLTGDNVMNTTRKHSTWWRSTTKHKAEALAAFGKLLLLRDAWVKGWEPNWVDDNLKWCIINMNNQVRVDNYSCISSPLSFPTEQMAKDFLIGFRDLCETAKTLL